MEGKGQIASRRRQTLADIDTEIQKWDQERKKKELDRQKRKQEREQKLKEEQQRLEKEEEERKKQRDERKKQFESNLQQLAAVSTADKLKKEREAREKQEEEELKRENEAKEAKKKEREEKERAEKEKREKGEKEEKEKQEKVKADNLRVEKEKENAEKQQQPITQKKEEAKEEEKHEESGEEDSIEETKREKAQSRTRALTEGLRKQKLEERDQRRQKLEIKKKIRESRRKQESLDIRRQTGGEDLLEKLQEQREERRKNLEEEVSKLESCAQDEKAKLEKAKVDEEDRKRLLYEAQRKKILESRIVGEVPLAENYPLSSFRLFQGDKKLPDCDFLRGFLHREGRLEIDAALELLRRVKEILSEEPNLLRLKAPINIIGDIHGQYYDLEILMEAIGTPDDKQFLFLGDYVDRGCFSVEVCFYLFAMKIRNPKSVFLLRGNHESRQMTSFFNFESECKRKYSEDVYDAFMYTFDALPIGALVEAKCGRFLCIHGGLSPEIENLSVIDTINRFMEPPTEGSYCDLLWSDPIEEYPGMNANERLSWLEIDYRYNVERGCSYYFGYGALKKFLDENQLTAVIRAHEVQRTGFREYDFTPREGQFPPLITVFSAPNYCDMYNNRAAYLHLTDEGYKIEQTTWADHPFNLPSFQNVFQYALPFLLDYVSLFFLDLLEKIEEDVGDELEDELYQKLRAQICNVAHIALAAKKLEEEKLKSIQDTEEILPEDSAQAYEVAKKIDEKNEGSPRASS